MEIFQGFFCKDAIVNLHLLRLKTYMTQLILPWYFMQKVIKLFYEFFW